MSDICIVVTGDFCPTEHVQGRILGVEKPEEIFGPALRIFREGELVVTNLEYPLTFSNTRIQKCGAHEKGHPTSAECLRRAGFNLVTLANNHILDYGSQGVEDTLNACRAAGLSTIGAGANLAQAGQFFRREIKGKIVAAGAACESEFSIASEQTSGANPLDLDRLYYQLREARSSADYVLLFVHGGSEFCHYPSPRVMRHYRLFIDWGASAVIAHHPHYIQGYEIYKGCPILYSMGKLMYTRMKDPHILEVPIAQIKFSTVDHLVSLQFSYFKTCLQRIQLVDLEPEKLNELQGRVRAYCYALGDKKELTREWRNYCLQQRSAYLAFLLMIPDVLRMIARRTHTESLIQFILMCRRCSFRRLLNLVYCESHRDVLQELFGDR